MICGVLADLSKTQEWPCSFRCVSSKGFVKLALFHGAMSVKGEV